MTFPKPPRFLRKRLSDKKRRATQKDLDEAVVRLSRLESARRSMKAGHPDLDDYETMIETAKMEIDMIMEALD